MSGSSSEEFLRTTLNSGGGASSSSFYYSTTSGSSTSSSVENISTSSSIENGDQLTITFVPRKCPSSRDGVMSTFLQDVFSIDNICLQGEEDENDRVSPLVPVENAKAFCGRISLSPPTSSPSPAPLWYDDSSGIGNSVSSLLKTVTNEDECTSSSINKYSHVIQHLSGDGILLKSLEKGAAFPYLHLSTGSFCVPPSSFLHDNREMKQGLYKEIKRVVPPDSWIKLDSHQDQCKSTWLFLGYKTFDKNNEVLEQSWKEWTGVRHLYLELRTDIHIRRISFFRRRDPLDCLDTFTYVAFMEIGTISGKTNRWLLDFVQRTRLERMHSTMTLYEEIELWEADSGIP